MCLSFLFIYEAKTVFCTKQEFKDVLFGKYNRSLKMYCLENSCFEIELVFKSQIAAEK